MRNQVLLVTPDRDWVEALMLALGDEPRLGTVCLARDAASARRLGSRHEPDVVILDSGLGEAAVAEVIRDLDRDPNPAHYVLLTDKEGAVARDQARGVGAADYLPRGLGAPHLDRFIHKLEGVGRFPLPFSRLPTISRPALGG
ncbi:MAG: response regulator [Thiohalospira sp.]